MVIASLQELSEKLKSACFHGKHPRTISLAYFEGVLDLLKTASQCLSGGVKVKIYSQKGNNYSGGLNLFTDEFDCFQENPRFSLSIFGLPLMRKVSGNCDLTEIFQKYLYSLHSPNGIVCFLFDIYAEPNRTLSIVDTISEYYLINRKNILADKYSCCCVTGFGSIQLFSLFSSICEISRVQLRNESATNALPLSRVLSVLGNHCSSSKYLTCIYKNASGNYCRYDAHQTKSFAAVPEKFSLTSAVKMLCAYAPFDDSLKKRYKLLVSVDSVAQRANSLFLYRLSSGKKIEDIEGVVGKDQADATICIPTYDPPKDNLLKDCICKLAGYRHEFEEWIKSPNKCVLNDELKRTFLMVDQILYKEFSSIRANNSSLFKDLWKKYCKRLQYSTNLMDEDSFSFFIYTRSFYLDEKDYILFFPFFSNQDMFFEVVVTDNLISNLSINALHNTYSKYFTILANALRISIAQEKITLMAVKTAIGTIMSRNGSHNIGSHVLAALSHNIGTMPEDRRLYQYIQHRMDYIATAATSDFPTWRQPTLLVSDMMRTFLSQTHLLNYISGSEGLHAYQFQNPSIQLSTQFQAIKLHVRRVREWLGVPPVKMEAVGKDVAYDGVGIEDFIIYPEDSTTPAAFDRDISVAIPGGVVGQHAFFTILENIIRNAAKHEWSKADKDKREKGNLDVYVDFRDNPQDGVVEMLVWNDRVGGTASGMKDTANFLSGKIMSSFISHESGELVRENWGLAEMRISAGYLTSAEIDTIGGIGTKSGAAIELVCPVVVKNGTKECLGFRFDFLKPKELLVVVPDGISKDNLVAINGILGRFGIEMMRMEDALKSKGLAYSYVLIDAFNGFDFTQDEAQWPKLPFRVLAPADSVRNMKDIVSRRVAPYGGDFYAPKNGEKFLLKIQGLGEIWQAHEDEARKFAFELLENVYASWVNFVRSARDVPRESMLVVDVAGDQKGGAKSLVTDSDLIHFVFEHSFNAAVRGYLKSVDVDDADRMSFLLAGALYSLITLDVKPVMDVEEFSQCDDNVARVAKQLIRFVREGWRTLPEVINANKTDQEGDFIAGRWRDKLRGLKTLDCMRYLKFGCENLIGARDKYPDVQHFVGYLCNMALEQARSFLSRYEERVVTVPPTFGGLPSTDTKGMEIDNSKFQWTRKHNSGGSEAVLTACFSADRGYVKNMIRTNLARVKGAFGICYLRHGDSKDAADTPSNQSNLKDVSLYLEPLSGAQSYLSSLIALQRNIVDFSRVRSDERLTVIREITGLMENALMRILLIDERATKFANEHAEVFQIFRDTRIFVCDEHNPAVSKLGNEDFAISFDSTGQMTANDFEIVIIHQGIVDKLLNDHSQAAVGEFLKKLINTFRYVVVTTGRGTPANIPAMARVLPFSVVENTLFKRYPEKILLVDTIMNILPGKETGK